MTYDFTGLAIISVGAICEKAGSLFAEEIVLRTGVMPEDSKAPQKPVISFELCGEDCLPNCDSYRLELDGSTLTISAIGLRGLIFGYSFFLRKTTFENGRIVLTKDISGEYIPDKKIRGHQLGYRTLSNTYDAWELKEYNRYYRDLMFFGSNVCEHIPYEGLTPRNNRLMKHDAEEFLIEMSRLADELDLDVSIWYPNNEESTEQAVARRKKVFENTPHINYIYMPGGDPGELPADEFLERSIAISKALKEAHPKAETWPSSQKPHSFLNWGEEFIEGLQKLPNEIDGIISGPNRAFTLDELRRKLPMKYPIRLCADITHNVRCEYPVHFNRDDWHYSLATALSRESINPRPAEYRLIHRLTRRYIVGSVSYSEGVNDDINKMVWGDMDFFPNVPLYETLLDYARVFFYGVSAEKAANGILGLEMNWQGDPSENPHIESTLNIWLDLLNETPKMIENWRFVQCLFRAKCDALVRRRRCFELELIESAKKELNIGKIFEATNILSTAFDESYKNLHDDIFSLAERLFKQIGLQLDVANYCADSWERGATLETIDLPVTDRQWFLNRLKVALTLPANERTAFVQRLLNRNKTETDEFYFSLAEHGFDVLGVPQQGEFYINFQGDNPSINNGSIPMSMLKLYDHYSFYCKLGGFLPGTDYKLRVAFSSKKRPAITHHKIIANGVTIYDGPQFGGERDEKFDAELLAPGFETATYILPACIFQNGCVDLEISEPLAGVMLSEFWIKKVNGY